MERSKRRMMRRKRLVSHEKDERVEAETQNSRRQICCGTFCLWKAQNPRRFHFGLALFLLYALLFITFLLAQSFSATAHESRSYGIAWRVMGIIALLVFVSFYFWRSLVKPALGAAGFGSLSATMRLCVVSFFSVSCLIGILVFPMHYVEAFMSERRSQFVSFLWLYCIALLYALLVVLLLDFLQLVIYCIAKPVCLKANKQKIALIKAFIALILGCQLTAIGAITALSAPDVIRLSIDLPLYNGPPYTLAFLSDVHASPTTDIEQMEAIVDIIVLEQGVKSVVLVGDIVDGPVSKLGPQMEPFRQLSDRFNVYFSTGNHEYYLTQEHLLEWLEYYKEHLGIRVLRNEAVALDDAKTLFLLGVDDYSASSSKIPGHGANFTRAYGQLPPGAESILVAHNPFQASEAVGKVGLVLNGHVHNGQTFGPFPLACILFKYCYGLYETDGTHIFVSAGAVYFGPPVRLGTRQDILFVTVK